MDSSGSWFIAATDGFIERHPQRTQLRGSDQLEACVTAGHERYVTWAQSDVSAVAVELRQLQSPEQRPLPALRGPIDSVALSCWTNTVAIASDSEVVWASFRGGGPIAGAAISTKARAISPKPARPGGRAFDAPAIVVVDDHGALARWSAFGFRTDALDLRKVMHVGADGEASSFDGDNGPYSFNGAKVGSWSRSLDRSAFAWSTAGKLFVVGPERGWSPVSQPREVIQCARAAWLM